MKRRPWKRTMLATLCATAMSVCTAAAAEWKIDAAHSQLGFKTTHLSLSKVPGRFDTFSGTLQYEEGDPTSLRGTVTIEAKSVNTNNEKRDEHLRNDDFFAVEQHPEITYSIEKVRDEGDGQVEIVGKMTMRGVTKVVILHGAIAGPVKDPWGNQRIAVNATGALLRRDFGIDYGADAVISNEIQLDIAVEAIQQ